MTPQEIQQVVSATLAEQKRLHENHIDDVVLRAISTILTSFGLEEEDRREFRADLQYVRKWRKSVEHAQGWTFRVVITAIVTGILGAFWIGLKAIMGK